MRKSAGLSKDELLSFVRGNLPDIIKVDVEEKEDYFVLILKYEDRIESFVAIHKIGYSEDGLTDEREKELLNKIRSDKQAEILKNTKEFCESLVDGLLSATQLEEVFKEKYRDKNVIYKVKKWYEIRLSEIGTLKTTLEAFYRRKSMELVPSFETIWEAFVKEEIQHEKMKEITEYLHGANERFKQILFAFDRIKDVLALGSGNDVWLLVNYHLFYFISLVKSLGDNLAWILKYYCKIKLNPLKVDLLRKGFQGYMKSNNRVLYSLIYNNALYEDFANLKEFRDIVLHRHALHVVPVQIGINGEERIMVPVDPKSGVLTDSLKLTGKPESPHLAEAHDKESIAKYGLKQMIVWVGPKDEMPFEDPISFCNKYIRFLSEVYDDICQRILLEMKREPIGKVTNYLSKLGVAIVELTNEIHLNDEIFVEGATTSVRQKAFSIQINKKPVEQAKVGQLIGLKVNDEVRENDIVYRLQLN